ncbi:hypothetical protein [Devosia sp. FJ2-5-3]|uniref:hypothetical protein n=1 Tax=Devosia sp. FJ2-5-3 TaxID=2976680 RepID=UPI0023D7E26B|nr:hypothetical protein [Devosia sp. FJ2-5-3]WEJ57780.1 hypothetical protein N0P34_16495 [Devosia sp. FJ2-5-3]
MRLIFIFLALFALSVPASAQEWGRYDNGRFGYSIAVPPGFVGQGESDNGDGQVFVLPGRVTSLTVWGGLTGVVNNGFEVQAEASIGHDIDEGWNITYRATTPKWASWSGTKGGNILYRRMVLLCDGSAYAAFEMKYGQIDRPSMDPVVERLVGSLRGDC